MGKGQFASSWIGLSRGYKDVRAVVLWAVLTAFLSVDSGLISLGAF